MSAPYVPFYTSDFLGGTSGMTAATKGVYITLLCLMYEEEGPLPQKWDTLARRCGCTLPGFTKAIQDLVDDGKVSVLGSGLWSEKCEKHIAQRSERRDSAKAAAEKRWEKVKQNQGMSDANAMPETCQPDPEPEPELKEEREEPPLSPKGEKPRRACSLPEGWVPSDRNIADAEARNFSAKEINDEADKFRDYHHAKGTRFKDWDAGWRTWLGNARKFSGRGMAGQANAPRHGQGSSIASIVARRRADGSV